MMMNLNGEPVLIVGGGRVAARKVAGLLECGAIVTVVSPEVNEELAALARDEQIDWIAQEFDQSILECFPEPTLIFGTTDDRQVNVNVYESAVERRIPCNIADVPDLCTFTVPAVMERGDLTIAVSTGGASPALARRIRERLEEKFGPEFAALAEIMKELRSRVLEQGRSSDENKELFFKIVDSDLVSALKDGEGERAVSVLRSILPQDLDPAGAVSRALAKWRPEG